MKYKTNLKKIIPIALIFLMVSLACYPANVKATSLVNVLENSSFESSDLSMYVDDGGGGRISLIGLAEYDGNYVYRWTNITDWSSIRQTFTSVDTDNITSISFAYYLRAGGSGNIRCYMHNGSNIWDVWTYAMVADSWQYITISNVTASENYDTIAIFFESMSESSTVYLDYLSVNVDYSGTIPVIIPDEYDIVVRDVFWTVLSVLTPLCIIFGCGLVGNKLGKTWGFFTGINIGAIVTYIVLSEFMPVWGLVLIILMDVLLLFGKVRG